MKVHYRAATEVATDSVLSALGVINGITLLCGKYSWVLIFLSAWCEEGRARPLEELKSRPGLCWAWVRFSGGVLIHILNMQSYNKAKGSNNIPGPGGLLWSRDRPSHFTALWTVQKDSLFMRSCNQSSLSDRQKPLDYLFPLKKGACRIFSSLLLPKYALVCVQKRPFGSDHHQNCHT